MITSTRQSVTRSEKKRNEIIKKALLLFVSHGYETTSMGDIADICKMSKGNFYNYFKSKKDLVHATINWATTGFEDELEIVAQYIKERGPEETLKLYISRYIDNVKNREHAYIFLNHVALNLEKKERQHLFEIVDRIRQIFEVILEQGVKEKCFRPMDTGLVSLKIYAICNNWAHYDWYVQKHTDIQHFKKETLNFILKGIKP